MSGTLNGGTGNSCSPYRPSTARLVINAFTWGALANTSSQWSNRLNNWAETAQKWGQYASVIENPQAALQGMIQNKITGQQ